MSPVGAVDASEGAIRAALSEVADPEIPTVSIVDLGMVESVHVEPDEIRVVLLPTFVGCPALEVIRAAVEARLSVFDRPLDVRYEYRVPWTSDRITAGGHRKLRASGFAPPAPVEDSSPVLVQLMNPVPCPHCGSGRTVLESAFGPTQCRAIYHCTACRQPFEAFKPV
ncbi:MAG TPA: 1,2-phenylacetyl-CoA epoxidase subunit PaaD [Candidatus Limnocylindrales bacterium]